MELHGPAEELTLAMEVEAEEEELVLDVITVLTEEAGTWSHRQIGRDSGDESIKGAMPRSVSHERKMS